MPYEYCTRQDILDLLPSDFGTRVSDADEKVDRWIVRAGKYVDTKVGPQYAAAEKGQAKFEDQPNTPPIIEQVSIWVGVAFALQVIKELSTAPQQLTGQQRYMQMAERDLMQIRDNTISVYEDDERRREATGTGIVASAPDRIFTDQMFGQFERGLFPDNNSS